LPASTSGRDGIRDRHGYCLGGRISLIAASGLGRKVAAAASFHGGRVAVADDSSSPHLAADRNTASVYVAAAKDEDRSPPSRPTCWRAR
jgi:carboxymethylenebutenolidase